MPGEASIRSGQYYGHPRNRFWPVLFELLGTAPSEAYSDRLALLAGHRIALWDVLASCRRRGSLDAAIEPGSTRATPIAALLQAQPSIHALYFNGRAAATLFARHHREIVTPPCSTLPSTSPANAAWSLSSLLQAWRVILPGDD